MADNTIFNDFTNKAPVPMVMFISGGGVYRPANSTDFVGAGGGVSSQVQLTGTNVMGITGSLPNVTIANPTSQVQLTGINQVGVSGVATVNQQQGGAATLTAVSGSASNVSLVSSNASRKGLLIYNNSLNNMYTKLGTTASITGFSFVVASSGFYEMPINYYTGQVSAIWSAAGGSGIVTEVI